MVQVVVAGVGWFPSPSRARAKPTSRWARRRPGWRWTTPAVAYAGIQQAYAGYVYGDSTCGQAALYGLGLTGIPVINVNNNCSTGSSALFLARQAVESAARPDCVLAVGFEQMERGALGVALRRPAEPVRSASTRWTREVRASTRRAGRGPVFRRRRAGVRRRVRHRPDDVFAQIAVKARKHAANNPYAVFRDPVTRRGGARLPARSTAR